MDPAWRGTSGGGSSYARVLEWGALLAVAAMLAPLAIFSLAGGGSKDTLA